jgi:hypothetical protein
MPNVLRRRRPDSAHLLAVVAIVLVLVAPAGAALVNAKGLATNAVESRHIKNGQVRTADIGVKAVANKHLATGAVKATNLATGSVGTVQVADASLTGTDIVDGSVTASDLAPGTVGASALAAGSIGSSLLADGSVTAAKLGAASVSSATIADGSIGTADVADGSIGTVDLAPGAVTSSKLATNSVEGGSLGRVVGAGVTAINVAVAQDPLDAPPAEDNDGTVVDFDTELWDTASMWGIGTATDVVLPSDGLYQAEAWVYWESNTSGTREAQIVHDGVIVAQDRRLTGSGVGGLMNQTIVATFDGSTGDVVRVRLSQNATATLDADTVRLTIRRIGTVA